MGGLTSLVTAALHLDGHLLPPRHAIAICCAVLRVQVELPLCEKGLEALLQIKQAHAVSKLVLRHLPHGELLVKAEDLVRGLVRCRWLLHRRRGRGCLCCLCRALATAAVAPLDWFRRPFSLLGGQPALLHQRPH